MGQTRPNGLKQLRIFAHLGGQVQLCLDGFGKKLMKVGDLMHTGRELPQVTSATTVEEAILEMSGKGLGMTTVVNENSSLLGIITDGDLRRFFQKEENPLKKSAAECMTRNPKTISATELASSALAVMEENKITSLIVVNEKECVEGVVHIHDLWRLELF